MKSRSRSEARKGRQETRAGRRNDQRLLQAAQDAPPKPIPPTKISLKPLTENQRLYDRSIRGNIITFGTGPAGAGKTWYAAMMLARMLRDGEIEKLIITRPAVEAGESLGFLPGELDEKYEPYFRPVRDALTEFFGSGHLEYLMKSGAIEARPLGLLRGASLKHAGIMFDEAQNATKTQMKMFLTRIGEDCKVVVNGDLRQQDIPGESGLRDAVQRLAHVGGVGRVDFTRDDIVRSGICKAIVIAYDE